MSDVSQPTVPTTSEPLGNAPEARTETGEIKSTQTPQSEPASSETKPPEPKAPEEYKFKVPEGTQLDNKLIEKATPIFKELGISQDGAQKLFDFYNEQAQALVQASHDQYDTTRNEWRTEALNDKTLGDGKELRAEVKQTIGNALNQLDPKVASEFKSAMDITGAGDNPAFIRAFYGLAKLVTEGTSVKGNAPSPLGQRAPNQGPRSAAQALYPNLPSSNA